eukprot:COSAG03_NODE_2278_length_2923_cov_2.247521_3_plen_372_part_00
MASRMTPPCAPPAAPVKKRKDAQAATGGGKRPKQVAVEEVHAAFREDAPGLTRPLLVGLLAVAHGEHRLGLGIDATMTREELLGHLHKTGLVENGPEVGKECSRSVPLYTLVDEPQDKAVADRLRNSVGGDKKIRVRMKWDGASWNKWSSDDVCEALNVALSEELRRRETLADQQRMQERKLQAACQRHRWHKNKLGCREGGEKSPRTMSKDTSLPPGYSNWDAVSNRDKSKDGKRPHTQRSRGNLALNLVDRTAEDVEAGTGIQVTHRNGLCAVGPAVLLGRAGKGEGVDRALGTIATKNPGYTQVGEKPDDFGGESSDEDERAEQTAACTAWVNARKQDSELQNDVAHDLTTEGITEAGLRVHDPTFGV